LLAEATAASAPLLEAARRVGRWIRAYQQIAPVDGRVELAERRAYIDERLRQLDGDVFDGSVRTAVLARVDGLCRAIGTGSVAAVAIHADLTPTNVLVGNDGRVTVLDFTMAKTGTAVHDLAHMYFHVATLGRRGRRRGHIDIAGAVQRALLEGYDASIAEHDPLFVLMVWQHAVCHVAMLAERRIPFGRAAYRWFLRRRWQDVSYLASSITRTAE
jgi:Ser/Thr protein kinase RdoA (MazF antagonist)